MIDATRQQDEAKRGPIKKTVDCKILGNKQDRCLQSDKKQNTRNFIHIPPIKQPHNTLLLLLHVDML